jgi:exodeoxyribonuclease VII large subunit
LEEILSVRAFNRLVAQSLSRQFPSVRIVGEVAQLTVAASGHSYLTLRDAQASLRAVLFRGDAAGLGCQPTEGQMVEVLASAGLYEPRGDFQIRIVGMKPAGQGSLYEAFLRRKALLTAEGLFDESRKRARPAHLQTIGVVTSTAGAAIRDFLVTLGREAPQLRVVVFSSLVQGPDAPRQLVEAIGRAAAHRTPEGAPLDALVLTRGGGSLEDLWAFNEEAVVRAFVAFPGHRVAGVGHETDTSLVDFAADHRAATPTAAAEWLAASSVALRRRMEEAHARAQKAMALLCRVSQQRLDLAARGLVHPRDRMAQHRLRLGAAADRMRLALRHAMRLRQGQAQQASMRLAALNPEAVLARGYAMVLDNQGVPVTSAGQLQVGMSVALSLRDGTAQADVTMVQPSAAPKSPKA